METELPFPLVTPLRIADKQDAHMRKCRRRKIAAAASSLAVLVVGLVVAFVLWKRRCDARSLAITPDSGCETDLDSVKASPRKRPGTLRMKPSTLARPGTLRTTKRPGTLARDPTTTKGVPLQVCTTSGPVQFPHDFKEPDRSALTPLGYNGGESKSFFRWEDNVVKLLSPGAGTPQEIQVIFGCPQTAGSKGLFQDVKNAQSNNSGKMLEALLVPHAFWKGPFDGNTYWHLVSKMGGDSLDKKAKESQVDFGTIYGYLLSIVGALKNLHDLGYVHNDISPHNVVIGASKGSVPAKLIDFGISAGGSVSFEFSVKRGKVLYKGPINDCMDFKNVAEYCSRRKDLHGTAVLTLDLFGIDLTGDLAKKLIGHGEDLYIPWTKAVVATVMKEANDKFISVVNAAEMVDRDHPALIELGKILVSMLNWEPDQNQETAGDYFKLLCSLDLQDPLFTDQKVLCTV